MYVATIPNHGSRPTILVRQGYRDGGKAKNRTLANLTHLPAPVIDLIRRSLKGERLAAPKDIFEIVPGGSRRSRQRDLVVAMVAPYIVRSQSKLATTRWWHTTTLLEILGVIDADQDELYDALDWLLERQDGIERFVIVGDRGMITQKQIETLRDIEGIDWIGALRPDAIRKLVEAGAVQMDLFDERNLFELVHAEFPGERLVACRTAYCKQESHDGGQSRDAASEP